MATLGGTSGTHAFNPSMGDVVQYACGLCGIRRTAILLEHMTDAHMAANFLLGDWSLKGVNLWQVGKVEIPLVAGVSQYPLDPDVVVMLDTYVVQGGPGAEIDRIMMPISRTEYASY